MGNAPHPCLLYLNRDHNPIELDHWVNFSPGDKHAASETDSTFRVPLSRNRMLILGVLLAQGLHIAAMHIPFMQTVLSIEPITFWEWAQVLILTFPLLIAMEIFKQFRARRYPKA